MRFVLSFFVCLFFLWWARLSEVVTFLLMIGFVFLFCLFFRWGVLHRVLLVAGWCQVLIQVVSFVWVLSIWYHLGLLSGNLGSWSQCSHSKAQGLIFGQEQRFYKRFVMALSEIKTNTLKQETKDEPQANGSYKIREP